VFLVVSNDNGSTWSAPRIIAPPGSGQIDVQVKVDPVDGKTVYASWLQNNKSVIDVAKSTDFGQTWSTVVANQTKAGTDKDILVVHGQDVYVGYDHTQTVWVSSSHDGGQTFTSAKVNQNAQFGWSLTGGAAIDNAGTVYFAWEGYTQNGGAKGPVNIYVSKSSDKGITWTEKLVDVSGAPPDCSAFSCGWAFLGPGTAMAADAAGKLYLLWNAGTDLFFQLQRWCELVAEVGSLGCPGRCEPRLSGNHRGHRWRCARGVDGSEQQSALECLLPDLRGWGQYLVRRNHAFELRCWIYLRLQ
jgi:hypothetical protein